MNTIHRKWFKQCYKPFKRSKYIYYCYNEDNKLCIFLIYKNNKRYITFTSFFNNRLFIEI